VTFEEFEKLFQEGVSQLQEISSTKGKEYANTNVDRLANFKRAAARYGLAPTTVLGIFLDKHMDSLGSYLKYVERNKTEPPNLSEPIEGRILDAIMYLHLLHGLVVDMRAASELDD
jgi:hypothetical protein